jgi:hypothetical protein
MLERTRGGATIPDDERFFRWVQLEEIEQLPLSASHRRIAQEVSRLGGGQRTRTQMLPFQGGG